MKNYGKGIKNQWLFQDRISKYWMGVKDGNPYAMELYQRHYSARHYKDGRVVRLFCGPGEKMILLTDEADALFIWRKFIDDSGQKGVNCAVFRNESRILSSLLIVEAVFWARMRWPGERFYTYINRKKIKSTNPGYCFQCAGWQICGKTKGGLIILAKDEITHE
jgi:hypothetical protein